jgi:hypothetical protein
VKEGLANDRKWHLVLSKFVILVNNQPCGTVRKEKSAKEVTPKAYS